MTFQKAVKKDLNGRVALCGPSGSGKTMTALEVAERLGIAYKSRVAFIDSERGSAKKYADLYDFDVLELESFDPRLYIKAIREAEAAGYKVLVIDSLSHAWSGTDGVLDQKEKIAKQMKNPNDYAAWRKATPLHNDLVDTILAFPGHVICTMRSKMEYVSEKDKDGKTTIRKVGLQPVQREGMEYEFDIVADVNIEHELMITGKSRCKAVTDQVYPPTKSGADKFSSTLITWLGSGENGYEPKPAPVQEQPPTQQSAPKPESGNGHAKPESGDMFDELKWLQTYEDMLIKSGVTHEKVASICRTATGKGVDEIEKASPVQRRNYKAALLKNLKEQGIEIS